jgi:branched-chain amino acid transport system permease protein
VRVLAAVFLPLAVVPVFTQDPYHMNILIWLSFNAVLAASLRFIMLAGEVNFAHAGFAGIGAYTAAVLATKMGMPFWVGLPLAGIASAIVASFFGYATLRLKGAYFFLASFAFSEVIRIFFNNFFPQTFGGTNGIFGIPAPAPITLPALGTITFGPIRGAPYFYIVLVVAVLCLLALYRMEKTKLGSLLKAISESDALGESVGISVMRYKLLAFVVGCFFAGVVGSLYAHLTAVIAPQDFSYHLSLLALVYVVVGGRADFAGPIVGAVLLTLLGQPLAKLGYYESVAYGLALILAMIFMPNGVVRLPQIIRQRFARRAGAPGEGVEAVASR